MDYCSPRIISTAFLAVCISTAGANAFGRDDRWTSGWGMGVAESIVTHGPGNSIYVACNHGGASKSGTSITFTLANRVTNESHVTLTFDHENPEQIWVSDGQIISNCRACAANFEYVLNKLKSHNSVHVMFSTGQAARFTLKGSSKAIGECKPDFYR